MLTHATIRRRFCANADACRDAAPFSQPGQWSRPLVLALACIASLSGVLFGCVPPQPPLPRAR
jgi:hypothetical protein